MIKSNRSELSRYYGNFRGVDFSSDHTLVSEKRFPYLVNMYKDYVSGGGQGIETIPGFRKRFVAPNGGKVHGIHSYKDKDSKRHVLVHAGTSLYDWGDFPNDAGFIKEVVAVAKDYDEYSSSIEGVGIAYDNVKMDVIVQGAVNFADDYITDVRAIRKVGSQRWISIYPSSDFLGSRTATYSPDAYSFTQAVETADPDENDRNKAYSFSVVIPKVVKNEAGKEIEKFAPGDSVEVWSVHINKLDNNDTPTSSLRGAITLKDEGNEASTGERVISITVPTDYSQGKLLWYYDRNGNQLSYRVSRDDLPKRLTSVNFNAKAMKAVSLWLNASKNLKYNVQPFVVSSDSYTVYALTRSYSTALEDIDLANTDFYQYDAEGNKVYLPKDISNGFDRKVIRCSSFDSASTIVDVNEYEELGQSDYVVVDASVGGGLKLASIRKKSDSSKIDSENYLEEGSEILIKKSIVGVGEEVILKFGNEDYDVTCVYGDKGSDEKMSDRESKSFVYNNKLYIIDGANYLVYDGAVKNAAEDAYIPTTYINIVPGGENADNGEEYEQRNMLSPYFKHTFIADGTTKDYYLNENMLDGIKEIKVYGEVVTDCTVDLANGKVSFNTAPPRSETVDMSEGVKYPELYAGVEITAEKGVYPAPGEEGEMTNAEFKSMINSATLATIFDNRVFFSGFASAPNLIVWSNLKNPSYIGVLNYVRDGVGTTPITAMLPVANALLVLKGDTEQDGAVYYHTPHDTGIDVMPKTYPSEAGLAGIGCLGAACNFLDDPVFVSRLGLEGISQLKIASERSKEHRSSLIDAKLVNLDGLKDAKICEWGGYLVLLVDGKIFLADSRQVYQNDRGEIEYEWYYLEDIGVFEGQDELEKYLTEWPQLFRDKDGNREPLTVTYEGRDYTAQLITDVVTEDAPTEVANGVKTDTGSITLDRSYGEGTNRVERYQIYDFDYAMYPYNSGYVAVLCDGTGEQVGGTFCPAVTVKTINDGEDGDKENLFFGTTNGVVCSFNFDQRTNEGVIPPGSYTFDNRAIYSGCALKMDNCGVPHMTKTTVKKSTVVKVKSFQSTAAKIRVRTNSNPYNEIARINATRFDFDNLDFSDFSFVVGEDTLFSVREKEKKWVEKQYYIYSDEYKKPFSLYYAAFKYYVAGEFKKQAAAVVSTTTSRPTSSSSGGSGYISKAPYIEGGYWYVNGVNTFVKAEGIDGASPYIFEGYWYINGKNLGVKAKGEDGKDYVLTEEDKEEIAELVKNNLPDNSPVKSVNGKVGNVVLGAADVGADAKGSAASAVSTHNVNTDAHNDIRLELKRLADIINDVLDSEDSDLNEMHEIVAYIKSNKSLIEAITDSKVNVNDIVNNLDTNVSDRPLSAAQGVALKQQISNVEADIKEYINEEILGGEW